MPKRSRNTGPRRGGPFPNRPASQASQHRGTMRSHPRQVSSLPLPTLLTISGAAIVKSRNSSFFHHKSGHGGERAANRKCFHQVAQPCRPSRHSERRYHGRRVTQPAGGYRVAVGRMGGENVASFNQGVREANPCRNVTQERLRHTGTSR